MNRRRTLSLSVRLLVAAGLVFAAVPFIRSFDFGAAVGDEYPRISVSSLEPGAYLWKRSVYQSAGVPDLLVVRDFDGRFRAFRLAVVDDKYWMPDVTWDRWAGACVDFGPDHTEGRLSPTGSIRCHDPLWADNPGDEWRWSYAGEAQGQWTPDLIQLEATVESGFLKIEG